MPYATYGKNYFDKNLFSILVQWLIKYSKYFGFDIQYRNFQEFFNFAKWIIAWILQF